jgi:hypothetical protein
MTTPFGSGLRNVLLAMMPIVALPALAAAPADSHESSANTNDGKDATARKQVLRKDRVVLRQSATTVIVEIYHVTGIGGLKLQPPTSGWPAAVVVHLHGFRDLESFTARAPASQLACQQSRLAGAPVRVECRLGDEDVDAVRLETNRFEVTLPTTLLETDAPLGLNWVDQWR